MRNEFKVFDQNGNEKSFKGGLTAGEQYVLHATDKTKIANEYQFGLSFFKQKVAEGEFTAINLDLSKAPILAICKVINKTYCMDTPAVGEFLREVLELLAPGEIFDFGKEFFVIIDKESGLKQLPCSKYSFNTSNFIITKIKLRRDKRNKHYIIITSESLDDGNFNMVEINREKSDKIINKIKTVTDGIDFIEKIPTYNEYAFFNTAVFKLLLSDSQLKDHLCAIADELKDNSFSEAARFIDVISEQFKYCIIPENYEYIDEEIIDALNRLEEKLGSGFLLLEDYTFCMPNNIVIRLAEKFGNYTELKELLCSRDFKQLLRALYMNKINKLNAQLEDISTERPSLKNLSSKQILKMVETDPVYSRMVSIESSIKRIQADITNLKL